jgi:nucleolar protein 15
MTLKSNNTYCVAHPGPQIVPLIKNMTEKVSTEGKVMSKEKKKTSSKDAPMQNGRELDMESRVVYLGRIPHGFYEVEMSSYFSQFGRITRLRLSRNPRTGASRHYAFIEFESAAVARIVAQTMHNYLLMGHLLQCRVVPRVDVHADTFKGANRTFKKVPWKEINRKRHIEWMSSGDAEQIKAKVTEMNSKQAERMKLKAEKLRALGYNFDPSKVVLQTVSVNKFAEKDKKLVTATEKEDWEIEYAEELAELSAEEK